MRAFIEFDDLAVHCIAAADGDTSCVGEPTWSIYVQRERRWWHFRSPEAKYTGLSYCGQAHLDDHREYISLVLRHDYGIVDVGWWT